MKYYEVIVIIHPALEGGHLKDDIVEIQNLLERKGGSIKNTEVWGRRKLAYLIDKQKYGTYIFMQYTGDSVKINEMNVELEHNPNVLAYQTIKIEESEMREQPGDLDTQIAGQSKTSDSDKSDSKSDNNSETESSDTPEAESTDKPVDDQGEQTEESDETKIDESVEEADSNEDTDESTADEGETESENKEE